MAATLFLRHQPERQKWMPHDLNKVIQVVLFSFQTFHPNFCISKFVFVLAPLSLSPERAVQCAYQGVHVGIPPIGGGGDGQIPSCGSDPGHP